MSLMDMDFATNLISYKTIGVGAVIVGILFIGILVGVHLYDASFKTKPLSSVLYGEIAPNSYFQQQAELSCVYFTKLVMRYQQGNDFDLFYNKLMPRIKPLFFNQKVENNSVKIYFSNSFIEFVENGYENPLIGQFPKIAKDYLKSVVTVDDDLHVDSNFEQVLIDDVVTTVMTTQEAQKQQAEMISEIIADATEIDTSQKDALMKRLISASYNCAVKDIKLHGNKGLNPNDLSILKKNTLQVVCDGKVYTHQKLLTLSDECRAELDVEGCYIIFNTFTNKYFVGKSDTMFSRVYSMLTSPEGNGCQALKSDINMGHLVLVKFIRLGDTDYKDVTRLQRDLILSYDCRQDKGYNR